MGGVGLLPDNTEHMHVNNNPKDKWAMGTTLTISDSKGGDFRLDSSGGSDSGLLREQRWLWAERPPHPNLRRLLPALMF